MSPDAIGRYEILHELGRGAMGVVYKARDPLIDRTVAVKTINLDASIEEVDAFERRFYREAKSAGRLSHPNIVTIHDVGRSGDSAYIAMEFLQGRSLREIIDSGVVLPPDEIADIAAQAADGLACAHENGVVHRDIKPGNIMLLDSGTVKITDFGIALLCHGSRTVGTVFGSPKYISPEQVVGQQADGRSDIFSLGAVLYELLTGAPAFTASDLDAVLRQVINEMPAAPSMRNRMIAPAFDRIVVKAMAKRPDDRYATARAMALALRSFHDIEQSADVQVSNGAEERPSHRRAADAKSRRGANAAAPPDTGIAAHATGLPAPNVRWQRRDTIILGVSIAMLAAAAASALMPKRMLNPDAPVVTVSPLVPPVAQTTRTVEPSLPPAAKEVPLPATRTAASINAVAGPAPVSRLAFAVTPWGEVYVDGRRRGISPPLKEIRLSPGRHIVEIRNTNFQRHRQTVDLDADASVRIKHKFQ